MTGYTNGKIIRVANFGAGVNSAAALLMSADYDEILFADTGAEWPETYAFIDYFEQKTGIKITRVKSKLGNIYNYYYDSNCYPTPTMRDCTGKFKIAVMRKYLREKYGKKVRFERNIFIDYGEAHRMHESDRKYEFNRFPLVDAKIDRDGCIALIESKGLIPPIKSGCYFCFFNNKKTWTRLRDTHPELWQKAVALEKNGYRTKKPLISMKAKNSQTLFECGCFNG